MPYYEVISLCSTLNHCSVLQLKNEVALCRTPFDVIQSTADLVCVGMLDPFVSIKSRVPILSPALRLMFDDCFYRCNYIVIHNFDY